MGRRVDQIVEQVQRPPQHLVRIFAACVLSLLLWHFYTTKPEVVEENPNQYNIEYATVGVDFSKAKIAKVSVDIQELNASTVARALRTHDVHNHMYGYKHFISMRALSMESLQSAEMALAATVWNKRAYLLSIIIAELAKPKADRLEWLFWSDADTIIMNPYTRLETFLPPDDDPFYQYIHLVTTKNGTGISTGAFSIRVHPWSVSLLSLLLSYPRFPPDDLRHMWNDSFAMQHFLEEEPLFNLNWTTVQTGWIYSIAHADDLKVEGTPHGIKGNMLIHFDGPTQRDELIDLWLDEAEKYLPAWSDPIYQNSLEISAAKYWPKQAMDITLARQPKAAVNETEKSDEKKPELSEKKAEEKEAVEKNPEEKQSEKSTNEENKSEEQDKRPAEQNTDTKDHSTNDQNQAQNQKGVQAQAPISNEQSSRERDDKDGNQKEVHSEEKEADSSRQESK